MYPDLLERRPFLQIDKCAMCMVASFFVFMLKKFPLSLFPGNALAGTGYFPTFICAATLSLIIVMSGSTCVAQTPSSTPVMRTVGAVSPVKLKNPSASLTTLDTEDGLAMSSIFSSFKDSMGNLWFGTIGAGVSKYDGRSFQNYSPEHGLAHSIITGIEEDRYGDLWFATLGGGISHFDGIAFKTYTMKDGLAQDLVISVFEDSKGNIWFGTFFGGVSVFDGKTFKTFNAAEGLAGDSVWCIAEDHAGVIYFGTNKGITSYNGSKFSTMPAAKDQTVRGILVDRDDNLWAGTATDGVYKISKSGTEHYLSTDGLADNATWRIVQDQAGHIWFATEGGVTTFDGNSFSSLTTAEGLPSDNVTTIAEDNSGSIWFGTLGNGVCHFDGNAVQLYETQHRLPSSKIRHITEDHEGNLWLATFGGGVVRFDGENIFTYNTVNGLPSNLIRTIAETRDHAIWIGTHGGGLSKLDGSRLATYNVSTGLPNNNVRAICEDNNGRLWVGTDGGIAIITDKEITALTTATGLPHNMVWDILQGSDGTYWLATYGGGLIAYDGSSFRTYTTADGLCSNSLLCLHQDEKGYLWVGGAAGGLSRFDGKTFLTFGKQQGLPDETVYDIIEGLNGQLWIGTNLGISSLTFMTRSNEAISAGLLSVDNAGVKKFGVRWDSFNSKTGYNIKDINTNALAFVQNGFPRTRTGRGLIWAGCGDDKLIRFDPSSVNKNSLPPKIVLTNLKLNDQTVCWYSLGDQGFQDSLVRLQQETQVYGRALAQPARDTLIRQFGSVRFDGLVRFSNLPKSPVLSQNVSRVTFNFTAIEPSRYPLVSYQFRLEGQDDAWSPPVKTTEATYSNLWEGNYVFKVRAQSATGAWSEPLVYHFTILPPWWRTPWMYLTYAGVFISLLTAFIKIRERALTLESARLAQIVEDRTNEVVEQMKAVEMQKVEVQKQKFEVDRQRRLVEQKNDEIITELKKTEASLAGLSQEMIHRFHAYDELEQELRKLAAESDPNNFKRAFSLIAMNKSLDKEWERFNLYFDGIYKDFNDKLRQIGQPLSNHELRMCALIKLGFGSQEIAMMLNIETSSVKMARYRLRKKLQLDDSVELQQYLQAL